MYMVPRIPEETVARYRALYESGIIIWHEKGRHGTIHNIKRQHVNELYSMLTYFLGPKCAWSQKNPDNTVNLEFVYQGRGKVLRPWYECGETVLFNDWKIREDERLEKMSQFHIGDPVEFTYKGYKYRGMIANMRKRVTVVVENQGKFYVPPENLKKLRLG